MQNLIFESDGGRQDDKINGRWPVGKEDIGRPNKRGREAKRRAQRGAYLFILWQRNVKSGFYLCDMFSSRQQIQSLAD